MGILMSKGGVFDAIERSGAYYGFGCCCRRGGNTDDAQKQSHQKAGIQGGHESGRCGHAAEQQTVQRYCQYVTKSPLRLHRGFDYSASTTISSFSTRIEMEEIGCSKESMIFSLMGSSRLRWISRRRFLAP